MSDASASSFSRLVGTAMARQGLGLRELCRRSELDPSFFSKVLAGKRNPPSEEAPLRRLASALELDPIEIIVAAGLIPADWSALSSDPELLRAVHALAGRARRRTFPRRSALAVERPRPSSLPEELL
ncbi:MAG TPA: hypothetical protein DCZ01_03255 [Elusimicrobia bacterium]|nr:MAG: hypothetical protein A2X37_08085 [Elusimicrobia bacterium GWA2_66_18]OGR72836.1 MAG: hypothetical protein A2X40_07805 [Elusimicrobia bacterium GWC2_65_9]HAZ07549.1 hypothetical protein [Elusimicrobiota bacterium]